MKDWHLCRGDASEAKMPIRQSDLLNSSVNRSFAGQSRPRSGQPTAFLSHSHQDALFALGLQETEKSGMGRLHRLAGHDIARHA